MYENMTSENKPDIRNSSTIVFFVTYHSSTSKYTRVCSVFHPHHLLSHNLHTVNSIFIQGTAYHSIYSVAKLLKIALVIHLSAIWFKFPKTYILFMIYMWNRYLMNSPNNPNTLGCVSTSHSVQKNTRIHAPKMSYQEFLNYVPH